MSQLTLGVVQCRFSDDIDANIASVGTFIRDAAAKGAKVILTPELMQGHYFCTTKDPAHFKRAYSTGEHPTVKAMQKLAAELKVFLPVSFFERDGTAYYNSLAMVDDQGSIMGVYRKTHIPDGPGYEEKFYFQPGDTGYKVWPTPYGNIGVGICWDQWYPETARGMMMKGADILLYPTAIGSEPQDASVDTSEQWQLVQRGHSVANVVPVAAANRIGTENGQTYYGSSFITDQTGQLVKKFGKIDEGVLIHGFDFDGIREERSWWGFFRDRRPEVV